MKVFIANIKKGGFQAKLWYLDIYIQRALSEDVFVVSDGRENCMLDIAASPEMSKDLVLGKCF